MRRLATGVLLAVVLGSASLITACKAPDSTWSDIPNYANANEISVRTWVVLPSEGVDWSGVEWKYYSSDDNYQAVSSFYNTELPKKGWQDMAGQEPDNILQIESSYLTKIGIYENVTTLEEWSVFSKNDGRDWVILWLGLKETEPLPGKTYITYGGKSHNTFLVILRSQNAK